MDDSPKKVDRFITSAFKEMFKRVGEKYPNPELTKDPKWYSSRYWSEKEQESFKKWLKKKLKKTFPYMNARKIEWEAGMFILSYGWTNVKEKANVDKSKH